MILSVDTDNVGLDGRGIGSETNVFDLDCPTVLDRKDDVIEVRDLLDHPLRIDAVVDVANFCDAARNHRRVAFDRVVDFGLCEAIGFQHHRVNVDVDAALGSTIGGWRDDAFDSAEHLPQGVIGDIVQVLSGLLIARGGEQHERCRSGRIKRLHHRRQGSRRLVVHIAHGIRGGIGHGFRRVDVLAVVVGDDAHPHQTLGFLFQDPVGLSGPTLHPTGDILLHNLSGHARIKGQNLHRRLPECGQNVHLHPRHDNRTQDDQREQRDRYEKRILKGTLDHASKVGRGDG